MMAQSKAKASFGFSVNGGMGGAIANGNPYKNYESFLDTNSKTSSAIHFNKGIYAWYTYSLGKKSDIQVGVGYQQTGFARKQTDLTFKNYTYPGIATGRIEDFSNTQKGITYNYRFHYLQIPIILNTYLGRSGDFKWVYQLSSGITPQVLLKHQLVANCNPGFSIEGKDQFKLDSSGFDAKRLAVSLQIGIYIAYRESKDKIYFFQPMVGIYPSSVSTANNSAFPFFVSLNVGVMFSNID
ncbi:MAG: outer membrane beta-barrel protein [bacterium]|nr:outer membrane beta-barrel protein [bacterium]